MFSCGDDLHTSRNSRPGTIEANVMLTEDDSKRDAECALSNCPRTFGCLVPEDMAPGPNQTGSANDERLSSNFSGNRTRSLLTQRYLLAIATLQLSGAGIWQVREAAQIHPREVGAVPDGLLAGDCPRSESTENDLELHKFDMRTLVAMVQPLLKPMAARNLTP
jgi:hypothetical protein